GDKDAGVLYCTAAVESARSSGEIATWGRALVYLARLRILANEVRVTTKHSLHSMDEFLDAAGARVPEIRAEVHALESELYAGVDDIGAARRHAETAEALAADVDDSDLRVR